MRRARLFLALLTLAGLLAGFLPALLSAQEVAPAESIPADVTVVRLYFDSRAQLDAITSRYDVWEVHHDLGYAVVLLSPAEYTLLLDQGYRMQVDEELTALVRNPDSIPGYPCYRTVEETYTSLQTLNSTYPDLAELIDYGDSWDKLTGGGPAGYDLYALRISNENITPIASKPVFVLFAEHHAREYVTSEAATRLAEYILQNYGSDPVITFFVDYHQIYIIPLTNPDGRKFAEQGLLWRKNTDTSNGCSYPNYGIDLNRNYAFYWGCCGGSSGDPCAEVYRGPSRASEPEIYFLRDLIAGLIPDQNGPNGDDEIPPAAPSNTTGIVISLHSYMQLVLWPWGFTSSTPPNSAGLQTIGFKFATYNYYTPQQSWYLYTTDGGSDDWVYGKLGAPSYTFEMGTSFFQDCGSFEGTIWPNNRPAFLYAWKIAKTPYMTAYGPDGSNAAVNPNPVPRGDPLNLTATINDSQNGGQNVAAAEYYVLPLHGNTPPGDPGTGTAMQPVDGSWNNPVENVHATVDTSGLTPGDYIIALRGKDSANNWGPFTAVFVQVDPGAVCYPVQILGVTPQGDGCSVSFTAEVSGTAPFTYDWDFGAFGSSAEPTPTVDFGVPGTYPYTLTVSNCDGVGQDTFQGEVTVDCCVPPSDAAFTYAPPDPVGGETVVFTGTASGSEPLTYDWAFGDDATGSGAVVSHSYAVGGDYTVVMTASNGCGSESAQQVVSVCRSVSEAGFTWTPITPTVGEWVAFHASAVGSTPITYAWDFGDGLGGSGANVSHRYTSAGLYTVVVTATNCGGATSVASHQVTVLPVGCTPVGISYVVQLVDGCTRTFSAELTGDPPYTYEWAFGDGATSPLANPTHTYTQTGTYSATLQVWNCDGAGHDTLAFTVNIDCTLPPSWSVYLPLVSR